MESMLPCNEVESSVFVENIHNRFVILITKQLFYH